MSLLSPCAPAAAATAVDEHDGGEAETFPSAEEEESEDDSSVSRLRLPRSVRRSHPTSSIVHPSRDDTILSCSQVLHRLILHNDALISSYSTTSSPTASSFSSSRSPSGCPATDPFHISHFLRPSYVPSTPPPLCTSSLPFTLYHQHTPPLHIPTPTPATLSTLLHHIFTHISVDPACLIIALIYLERLLSFPPPLLLCSANHVLLLTTALLVALKVWDDRTSYNLDFTAILPLLSTRQMARLEAAFVQQLHWTLYISASEYAHYYYALRSISKSKGLGVRQKLYSALNIGAGSEVQERSRRREGEEREMPQSL